MHFPFLKPPTFNSPDEEARYQQQLEQLQRRQSAIMKITMANWRAATALAEAWVGVDHHLHRRDEVLATHPMNPNRREPRPIPPLIHPSVYLSQQFVLAQPAGSYPGAQPGYHWGYYNNNGVQIALDADTRESALALHQGLDLLLQDPTVRQDLVSHQINRVRIRHNLVRPDGSKMLGYYDGNGVFSLDAGQLTPHLAATAAHQVGHAKYGNDSETLANQYAGQYRTRNQSRFRQWQRSLQVPLDSPAQMVQQSMDILKRRAPQVYEAMKGAKLRPNDRTAFARPHDILTQMAFVKLQTDTEQDLAAKGHSVKLPREMDDCYSHNPVSITLPTDSTPINAVSTPANSPTSYRGRAPVQVQPAQPTQTTQFADHDWIQDPTLPQRSSTYSEWFIRRNRFSAVGEGGMLTYRGLRVVGLREHCETLKTFIDECWADAEARSVVWSGRTKIIYASRLGGFFGWSDSRGNIIVDPRRRDAIHGGGTVMHEAYHENGLGEDRHPFIWQKQNEFAARRYQAKGITNYSLPYPHLARSQEQAVAAEAISFESPSFAGFE
jgi:hypothetical protein